MYPYFTSSKYIAVIYPQTQDVLRMRTTRSLSFTFSPVRFIPQRSKGESPESGQRGHMTTAFDKEVVEQSSKAAGIILILIRWLHSSAWIDCDWAYQEAKNNQSAQTAGTADKDAQFRTALPDPEKKSWISIPSLPARYNVPALDKKPGACRSADCRASIGFWVRK